PWAAGRLALHLGRATSLPTLGGRRRWWGRRQARPQARVAADARHPEGPRGGRAPKALIPRVVQVGFRAMRNALAGAVVLLSLVMSSLMLLAAPVSAAEVAVTATDFQFNPSTANANVGDTIRFTNVGPSNHRVVFDAPLGTDLGEMSTTPPANTSVSPMFTQAHVGTVPYH